MVGRENVLEEEWRQEDLENGKSATKRILLDIMNSIRGGGGARNVGCRFKLFGSVESTFIFGLKSVDL